MIGAVKEKQQIEVSIPVELGVCLDQEHARVQEVLRRHNFKTPAAPILPILPTPRRRRRISQRLIRMSAALWLFCGPFLARVSSASRFVRILM